MKKFTPREKRLITVAGGALMIFLLYQFVLVPMLDYSEQMHNSIPKLKMDLLAARRLKGRYQEIDGEIQNIQDRVDKRQKAFNPYDFLDKLSRREKIRSNLDKITSESEEIDENYREDIVKIRLKNVSLEKLVRFLYNIENSGQLLTVKELTIEPDRRDSELLDVKFEVSTFAKTEK